MLCDIDVNIVSNDMAVGSSGRIVIEIDPELKQELYSALSENGVNLKQWFLENAHQFLDERLQPTLPIFKHSQTSGGQE